MAMRDLIPWGRQENRMPAMMREEERSPFAQFRREVDRLFDDFFRAPLPGGGWSAAAWPSVEVSDTDQEVRVTAELPGMNEKDVELTVQDGMLAIRGERKSESEDRDAAGRSAITAASSAGSRFPTAPTTAAAKPRSATAC